MTGLRKLPEMSCHESGFWNRLGTLSACLNRPGEAGWQVISGGQLTPDLAVLVGQGEHLLVSLSLAGHAVLVGERQWWEYDSGSQNLAWSIAHNWLIDQISELTGQGWDFTTLLKTEAAINCDANYTNARLVPPLRQGDRSNDYHRTHRLLFLRLANQDKYSELALGVSETTMLRLVRYQSQKRSGCSLGSNPVADIVSIRHLALSVEMWLPPLHETVTELDQYEPADLMLLGSLGAIQGDITIATRYKDWAAKTVHDGGRLSVVSVLPNLSETGFFFNLSQASQTMSDQSTQAAVNDLSALTMQLDFRVGEQALSLDELASIQPGSVLTLENPLESAQVDVFANGRKWADGQLIALGDQLAVQISRFC